MKTLSVLALSLLSISSAFAANGSLKRDVVCQNKDRSIVISKELERAQVVENGAVSEHRVDYLYHTGGSGQILVVKVIGLDDSNQETVISNIYGLSQGEVAGQRIESEGYGTREIESFVCSYL